MKKLLTLVIVIFAMSLSSVSYSQTTLTLSLEGGVNIANANITPSPTTSSSGRTGLIFGGLVDIGFTPKIALETGLRYVMKGFTQNGVTTNLGVTNLTFKTNYLEFPVLLKVKFPLTEVKPYLIGGPTLGLKLTADLDYTSQAGSGTQDNSTNVESIDFGLLFGGGLDFNIAPKVDLFIQGAYSLGISNVEKPPQNQVTTTSTTKTYGIQLTGGARFKL